MISDGGLLDYKKETWAMFGMNTVLPSYTLKI